MSHCAEKIGKTIKNRFNAQPLSNFIQEISKFEKKSILKTFLYFDLFLRFN